MDILNINTFDNTGDFAGVGGSSSPWFDKIKTFAPKTGGGGLTTSKLTPAEIIMQNAKLGKASASPIDALPQFAKDAFSWADIGRIATVTLGAAFLIIAVASIAFAGEKHLLSALPGLGARIS